MRPAEPLSRAIDDEKKTTPRRAILWGREDLLEKAVESILVSAGNWETIKILDDHDIGRLVQEVARINPEIVLVNLGNCNADPPLPILLMERFPQLKIVTFNPKNNLIEVYDRQAIWIKEAADLLSVINESSMPNLKGGDRKP